MIAERLTMLLRANAVAVTGVTIGDDSDRSTWTVHPAELQGVAQPWIDAFTLPSPAQMIDEGAAKDVDVKALKAVLMEIYPFLGAGKPTLPQLRNNILARYKTL